MKFIDTVVDKEDRFSIGIEKESGRFYVSFPVSNSMADYEEYYEIDKDSFDRYVADPKLALPFVEQCRKHLQDHLLIVKPGSNRGTPM